MVIKVFCTGKRTWNKIDIYGKNNHKAKEK